MSGHTLPLPSFHARYRLGNMLRKVRRRLHHGPEDLLVVEPSMGLPETQHLYAFRQVFAQARRMHARNLAELKSMLPMLENDFPVATAVLFRLLLCLEACESDCQSWPLSQHSLDSLLGILPAGQLQHLLEYASVHAAVIRPRLFVEGKDSLRVTGFWAGLAGNAYLQAAMMAFAHNARGCEALWNMIHPNIDRRAYSVSFPGQAPLFTVAPTPAESLLFLSAGPQGYWPALIEKAAACFWPYTRHHADEGPGPLLCTALELLSGQAAQLLDTSLTPLSALRTCLSQAFDRGHVVVAACNHYPWLMPGGQLPAEAYAVTGYDSEHDTISLFRATGQNLPQDAQGKHLADDQEGLISVPLMTFAAYFSHVATGAVGQDSARSSYSA